MVTWVETVRGVIEGQRRDMGELRVGLQHMQDAVQTTRSEVSACRSDIETRLSLLRGGFLVIFGVNAQGNGRPAGSAGSRGPAKRTYAT